MRHRTGKKRDKRARERWVDEEDEKVKMTKSCKGQKKKGGKRWKEV